VIANHNQHSASFRYIPRSGWEFENAALAVGKYITTDLFASYEQ